MVLTILQIRGNHDGVSHYGQCAEPTFGRCLLLERLERFFTAGITEHKLDLIAGLHDYLPDHSPQDNRLCRTVAAIFDVKAFTTLLIG